MAGAPRNISLSRRALLQTISGASITGLAGCLVRGESSDLEGRIVMDGSNTVLPHGAAVAEEFQWRNNRVQIPVRGSGTGAGFQRFCVDETDIQNASRRISPSEEQLCETNQIEYLELETLLDGIALWVHPENDWVDCLTVEEIHEIWRSGSTVSTWQDVNAEWPDEEIELYGRDPASGTFDYFTEAINGEIGNIRSDYSASADTNVIVRGVRGNKFGLGWGGAGYYYENEESLKLLAVDNGDGCVLPTRETIETRQYQPLARPMFAYFNASALNRDVGQAFARFYFTEIDDTGYEIGRRRGIVEEGEVVTWTQWAARRVGFFAIPDEIVAESKQRLEAVIEGRR